MKVCTAMTRAGKALCSVSQDIKQFRSVTAANTLRSRAASWVLKFGAIKVASGKKCTTSVPFGEQIERVRTRRPSYEGTRK